jgi:hypothetical protein
MINGAYPLSISSVEPTPFPLNIIEEHSQSVRNTQSNCQDIEITDESVNNNISEK